jgi:hypothetical protein
VTLSEMADFVCGKVRQTDAAAVSKCKDFLRQRYEMLYHDQLWRSSLYFFAWNLPGTIPDSAGDPNDSAFQAGAGPATLGIYFLPTVVHKVVALRLLDGPLPVLDETEIYRGNLDEYSQTGEAQRFSILPPAVAICGTPDQDNLPFTLQCESAEDVAGVAQVRWVDGSHMAQKTSVTLSEAGTEFGNNDGVALVDSVTLAVAPAGRVFLQINGTTVSFCPAGKLSFPRRQRIRVFPRPPTSGTQYFEALVKRAIIPLEDDNDEATLEGIDNCLMAFAQADMLQRSRQYGKAQLVTQEAAALFEQFKRVEIFQQAHQQRVIPMVTETSGDVDYMNSKGYW